MGEGKWEETGRKASSSSGVTTDSCPLIRKRRPCGPPRNPHVRFLWRRLPCAAAKSPPSGASGAAQGSAGVDEASGIVRTAPKVLPRRQRSTYESDDDFCNDPEELESRQAQKKAARPKKERPSLFVRAIGSLARREYSRRDLEAKLRRSLSEDEDPDEVGRVLDRLEGAGYLSDARFAESRARSRSRVMGDARIRRELRQCGVAGEHVDAAMDEIEEPEEVRAYRLWARRFGELPADRKERDRQIRFMMYRGFGMSAISRVLKGAVEPPDDMA